MQKSFLLLLAAVSCLPILLFGQDDEMPDAIRALIDSTLRTRLRSKCEIDGFVNIDAELARASSTQRTHAGIFNFNDRSFEDPYGTLTHCTIFTYNRVHPLMFAEDRQSIGIFKDNQVIALLDTAISTVASSNGRIKKVCDLNKDGEVDIVLMRALGVSPPPWEGFSIFSWNGVRLRAINALTPDNFRESVIIAPWDFMEFIDTDGDGIYELTTSFEDENGIERYHTYSWNGTLYGEWGQSSKALLEHSSRNRSK